MKWLELIAPFFYAAVPVLFFYCTNEIDDQPIHVVVAPLCITMLVAFLTYAFSFTFTLDLRKAATIAVGAVVSIFLPPIGVVLALAMGGPHVSALTIETGAVLIPVLFLGAVVYCVAKFRIERWLGKIAIAGVFLFAMQFAVAAMFLVQAFAVQIPQVRLNAEKFACAPSAAKPDVYFIILDGYASPETFTRRFDHSSHSFTRMLEFLGFTLVPNSFSNYPMTELSLGASLNMQYMDRIGSVVGKDSDNLAPLYNAIQNNRLIELAHQIGYKFINVAGRFGPSNYMPRADANLNSGWLDMFSYELAEYSGIGFVDRETVNLLPRYYMRCQERQLELLLESSKIDGPKVVFCHLLAPHPPFIFDAEGNRVATTATFSWPQETALNQARYVNQSRWVEINVLAAVKDILRNYPLGKPVIIIQSDHGPGFGAAHGLERTDEYLYDRQRIFNAMFLPDELRARLPLQFSPVNNFRFVFSSLAGCLLPPLPNRAFFCTYEKPWDQTETTRLYASTDKAPAANQ